MQEYNTQTLRHAMQKCGQQDHYRVGIFLCTSQAKLDGIAAAEEILAEDSEIAKGLLRVRKNTPMPIVTFKNGSAVQFVALSELPEMRPFDDFLYDKNLVTELLKMQ